MDVIHKVVATLQTLLPGRSISIESMEQPLSQYAIDSMMFVSLVVALESEFGFDFDDDHLVVSAFSTVGSLAAYITEKMAINEVSI